MSKWELPDCELKKLDRLAHINIIYLVLLGLSSFFVGAYALSLSELNMIIPVSLIGISGSTVAALTSCLDRYSTGFEKENGKPYPKNIEKGKGKFNRRFSRWLFVRPYLGAIMAPVFIWGLKRFSENSEGFIDDEMLGFTAFMAGLLAKSVIELIKGLFNSVFKS